MMKAEDYEALANGDSRTKAMEMMVRRLKGNAVDVGVSVRPNAHRLVRGIYTGVAEALPDIEIN